MGMFYFEVYHHATGSGRHQASDRLHLVASHWVQLQAGLPASDERQAAGI